MIQGAVYTDRLIVQNLCDGIYVSRDNVFDADLLWRLTHVFECVTHLIANLDVLYARLAARLSQVSPSDLPALLKLEPEDNHQRFFPASQSFKDKNGKVIHLTYEDAIRKDAWGTTYRARTSTGQMVVVKFVQKYGIDAHRFLAEMGVAPEVLYFGDIYENVIDRRPRPRMVVMEFIDGQSAFATSLTPSQCKCLRDAIKALHDRGFVHGDLRSPNIYVGKNSKVYILDFDWVGLVGKVFYPYSLAENNDWPAEVKAHLNDMLPIKKAHDQDMLQRLVGPFEAAAAAAAAAADAAVDVVED